MKTLRYVLLPSFLIFLMFAENLYAIPAFSKQTGLECLMCHVGKQTNLNSMGRRFARSAYTMSGDSSNSLISAQALGFDASTVLNPSIMLKARADFGNDVVNGKGKVLETADGEAIAENNGMYEIFKASTVNLAGKLSDNFGTILEFREKEGEAIFNAKVISSFNVVDDSYSGVTVFTTNHGGPFSGMETYNTGLYKPLRQFENHKLTNAAQAADLGTGQATGVQAFYSNSFAFLTLGAYAPIHNSDSVNVGNSMIPFARIALEYNFGDLNLIVGAYGLRGTTKANNTVFDDSLSGLVPNAGVTVEKDAYGVDLQLEGLTFSYESMLTINVVLQNKTTLDNPELMNYTPTGSPSLSIYGDPYDADLSAYSISYELYPLSSLGVKMAYLDLDDKGPHTYELDKIDVKDRRAYSLGFDYSFRQNVTFTMEYSYVQSEKVDVTDFSDLLSVLTVSF